MNYIFCQNWKNTDGNHAGMKHMCQLLKENYPGKYELIIFPDNKNLFVSSSNKYFRFLRLIFLIEYGYLCIICLLHFLY